MYAYICCGNFWCVLLDSTVTVFAPSMRVLIARLARIIGSKLPTVVCECLKRVSERSEQCLKTCYPQFIPQAPAQRSISVRKKGAHTSKRLFL